jgi:hypothetical protein
MIGVNSDDSAIFSMISNGDEPTTDLIISAVNVSRLNRSWCRNDIINQVKFEAGHNSKKAQWVILKVNLRIERHSVEVFKFLGL